MKVIGKPGRIVVVLVWVAVACAKYEPKPITQAGVNEHLKAPEPDALKVATAQLRHPILKPLAVDWRNGLSPEDAAVVAVIVNPSLRAERDRRDVAGAQLVQAGLLPNPQFTAGLEFPHGAAPPDDFTGYNLGVSWDVTSLIGRDEKKRSAQAQADSVALDVAWKEWQVAQSARLAVYQTVSAQMQLRLARELELELKETRDLMRKAADEHLKTSLDSSAAETAWLEAHATALELERTVTDRRLALNKAMGLEPAAMIKLKENIDLPRQLPPTEQEELIKSVEQRRLDLLALKKGYESQDAMFRVAVLSQFPRVNVGFTEAQDTSNVKTHGVGVTVDLPIFDRNQAVIAEEKATRQKLYDEYVDRVVEARSDVATALADIDAVSGQIKATESALPVLQRLEEDYRTAMEARSVDILSYYTARSSVTQKRIDAIKLRQELAELETALELASGAYLEMMEAKTHE